MSQPTRLVACPSAEAHGQAALCPLGAQHPACEAQKHRPLSQARNRGLKAQPNSRIPSQISRLLSTHETPQRSPPAREASPRAGSPCSLSPMWVTLGNVGGRDAGLGSGAPRPEMGAGPVGPCQPPCRQQPAQYSLVTIKTLINRPAGRVPANHTGRHRTKTTACEP